ENAAHGRAVEDRIHVAIGDGIHSDREESLFGGRSVGRKDVVAIIIKNDAAGPSGRLLARGISWFSFLVPERHGTTSSSCVLCDPLGCVSYTRRVAGSARGD